MGIYLPNNNIIMLLSLEYVFKNLESDFLRIGSVRGGIKENSQPYNLLKYLILRSINF